MRSITSAPAVATSRASSSRPASVSASVSWARVTPTSTMRSRTVREIRVSVNAESFGVTAGPPPGSPAGPRRSRPPSGPGPSAATPSGPSDTWSVPPGLCTSTVSPTRPQLRAAAAAAALPVPQARVSPTPRSHTRRVMAVPPGPTEMNSTLIPPGCTSWSRPPTPATSTSAGSGPRRTRWGLPMSTWRARRSANCWGWSGPSTASPMSTEASAEPGASPGTVLDGPHAGQGRAP